MQNKGKNISTWGTENQAIKDLHIQISEFLLLHWFSSDLM